MLQSLKNMRFQTMLMKQRFYCMKPAAPETVKTIPKNLLEEHTTAHLQKENGQIYDKKPFKMQLEGNKSYSWCLCGQSNAQPFCDGTHKNIFMKIKIRPIRFKVEKSGDYWLCNCKQTKHRPFCDGTHKLPEIQGAKATVR